MKKKDTEWFKNKIKDRFNDKVILLSKYNGSLNKVKIKTYCDIHGWEEKEINAKNIFAKSFTLCSKCSYDNRTVGSSKSKEELYEEFKNIIESKNGKLLSRLNSKTIKREIHRLKKLCELLKCNEISIEDLMQHCNIWTSCSAHKANKKQIQKISNMLHYFVKENSVLC